MPNNTDRIDIFVHACHFHQNASNLLAKASRSRGRFTRMAPVMEHVEFRDFTHVREFFNSADYVSPYTVFDIGGNNYRLVVIVRYKFGKVFVQRVMTHREYDDWNKLSRKGKV